MVLVCYLRSWCWLCAGETAANILGCKVYVVIFPRLYTLSLAVSSRVYTVKIVVRALRMSFVNTDWNGTRMWNAAQATVRQSWIWCRDHRCLTPYRKKRIPRLSSNFPIPADKISQIQTCCPNCYRKARRKKSTSRTTTMTTQRGHQRLDWIGQV